MDFHTISPSALEGNVFDRVGKQWMLVAASDGGRHNAMTASWGGMGVLWNKNVFFCFVRPQRYTHAFTEQSGNISLSFFGEEYRGALTFYGRHSGRDCDKERETGLTVFEEDGFIGFSQAETILCGKKLYADTIRPQNFIDTDYTQWYGEDDFHTVYVCEIVKILKKDG